MSYEDHGGLDITELRRLGLDAERIIDFSVNINPYGPSPHVASSLANLNISSYPDRQAVDLTRLLAELNGVSVDNVLVGNGTAELIWLAAQAFLRDGLAVIVSPTFGEYERAAVTVGAEVVHARTGPADFTVNINDLCTLINKSSPDVVFLCNPNNPTGTWISPPEVELVAAACGKGLLVLDEAYRSFVTQNPFGGIPDKNVIVLRSMTKDFALAGLRLGYVLADSQLVERIAAYKPPWSVSSIAQAAGTAVLSDLPYLEKTLAWLKSDAGELYRRMMNSGAKILKSSTHFYLVDVSPKQGGEVRRKLLSGGIQVRDCASFGLPQYIRIGARMPEHNSLLVEAWSNNC